MSIDPTRTGILPGAPLTADSAAYQFAGIEPWSVELVNVNVGIPDPTYTRTWQGGPSHYHQALGPVWVDDGTQGPMVLTWDHPTEPRHEGVSVLPDLWRVTVHASLAGDAVLSAEVDGDAGEDRLVPLLTPTETTQDLADSGRWTGTHDDEIAPWQVRGPRAYLARYSYASPFGHSMGDGSLSARTAPRAQRVPVVEQYDRDDAAGDVDGHAEMSVGVDVDTTAARITTTIATACVVAWGYDGRVIDEWGRL